MRTDSSRLVRVVLASLLMLLLSGCRDESLPTDVLELPSAFSVARTAAEFGVGPLTLMAITVLRPDGRFHLRDVVLNGPATGDIVGNAYVVLNANLDRPGGSGPAWGRMTIVTTGGDVWQGGLTGRFQGFGPGAIQLFANVLLHGPDQQSLRAACRETTPTSETLICSGQILAVHN